MRENYLPRRPASTSQARHLHGILRVHGNYLADENVFRTVIVKISNHRAEGTTKLSLNK